MKIPGSNTIVSALVAAFASKTACRKLPEPVSFVLVTTKVSAAAAATELIKINVLNVSAFVSDLVVVILPVLRGAVVYQPKAPSNDQSRQKFFKERRPWMSLGGLRLTLLFQLRKKAVIDSWQPVTA